MPGKERLVYRNLFDSDNARLWFQLDDLVYKQERMPVRQYFLDLYGIEDRHKTVDNRLSKQKAGKRAISPAYRLCK